MPFLLPLGAACVGFAAAASVFSVFSDTRNFSVACSVGLAVAVVAGFLEPVAEAALPFLDFGAVEAGTHRLAGFASSTAAVQTATIAGGCVSVLVGGCAAVVPGCVVRFVCCGSEQGWWLAWLVHGLTGALAAALVSGVLLGGAAALAGAAALCAVAWFGVQFCGCARVT